MTEWTICLSHYKIYSRATKACESTRYSKRHTSNMWRHLCVLFSPSMWVGGVWVGMFGRRLQSGLGRQAWGGEPSRNSVIQNQPKNYFQPATAMVKMLGIDKPYIEHSLQNHVPHTANRSKTARPALSLQHVENDRKWSHFYKSVCQFLTNLSMQSTVLNQLFVSSWWYHRHYSTMVRVSLLCSILVMCNVHRQLFTKSIKCLIWMIILHSFLFITCDYRECLSTCVLSIMFYFM